MIVIPMAGESKRFFNAGYKIPKYQLKFNDSYVFDESVKSFERYFKTDLFLFIANDSHNAKSFIKERIKKLGIQEKKIIILNEKTQGQAETIYKGIEEIANTEELIIFNIDTFRPNYLKPNFLKNCSGYLELFIGEGDHWSFAKVQGDHVIETAEKKRISNLCSSGLYYFREKRIFEEAFLDALVNNRFTNGELYVAPLYNYLISKKLKVCFEIIELSQIFFCGTPTEYQDLEKKMVTGQL